MTIPMPHQILYGIKIAGNAQFKHWLLADGWPKIVRPWTTTDINFAYLMLVNPTDRVEEILPEENIDLSIKY